MHCPACGNELKQMVADEITVEVCEGGCGGLWFDHFEIQRFDEPCEQNGTILLEIARDPSIQVDHTKRRLCPKCRDIVMMRHFYSPKREIEVDECPKCGGLWLDAGELATLRDQYPSEAARHEAAEEYINEILGQRLDEIRAQSDGALAKARRIARMLRLICPSYYIPGKQPWGAF